MPETFACQLQLTTKVVIQQNDAPPVRRTPRLAQLPIPWLLFFGSLAVYWLTRTHLNTFDAVAYANQIGLAAQTGKLRPLFHPHHLLFNALGYGVWRLARLVGYGGGPLIVMQSLNAVLGAGGVALFYLTLRWVKPMGVLPQCLALGLAGSFGWWICATDGRVNLPSNLLLLAAFYGLLKLSERTTRWQAATVGALSGLAVLFHESAGLFGIVGDAARGTGCLERVIDSRVRSTSACLCFRRTLEPPRLGSGPAPAVAGTDQRPSPCVVFVLHHDTGLDQPPRPRLASLPTYSAHKQEFRPRTANERRSQGENG